MATLKRLEKRMNDVEAWVKDFNNSQGPKQTMDNLNWLVGQTRQLGDRLSSTEQQAMQMQQAIEQNSKIVNDFVEKHELVHDWQAFLAELQKEAEDNAVQEQQTEEVSVQEEAKSSKEAIKAPKEEE